MDIHEFKTKLFQRGKSLGFSEMEIFYSASKSTSIKVFNQSIDEYTISEKSGISFRGMYNGQMGYSYAEKLDEESIKLLLEEGLTNSKILEVEAQEDLFKGSKEYAAPFEYSKELDEVEPEILIEGAFEMERIAFEADKRVQMVQYCGMNKSTGEILIANTKGLNCYNKSASVSGGIYLVVNDGKETTTGGEFDFTITNLAKLNFKDIAIKAVREAVSKLGGSPIKTGEYPVILRYDVATELLGSFAGVFSGEAVEKGYSKFAGRINEKVAGENITFVDDPLMKGVPTYANFDAEGYATRKKEIIKDGKLITFMHNRQSAKKAGVESTGNAGKGSYRSTVSIGPHNLYLKPGQVSLEELIATVEEGVLIVELQGTNAGINTVSGDFSLYAIGFLIENGEILRPVNQVTVSGNYFDLLNNIEEIGNDLDIRSSFTSPSIKVKLLSFSGKTKGFDHI